MMWRARTTQVSACVDDSKSNRYCRSSSTHCRCAADALERLDLGAVVFHPVSTPSSTRRYRCSGLGERSQILRHDPPQHKPLLHLRPSWPPTPPVASTTAPKATPLVFSGLTVSLIIS